MGDKGKKRFNPYKVRTHEVTKFRGITDENELANADNAYVSGLTNLESFKLRTMNPRNGQSRGDEYTKGTIHQGGSFVTTRAHCAGTGIYAESKTEILSQRPKKLPWRNVVIPTVHQSFEDLQLTVRCRDLDVPEYASRVTGKDNDIITAKNWMDCFLVTCSDIWSVVGDVDGYSQVTANADSEYDMTNAFDGGCYESDAEPENPEEGNFDTPKPIGPPPPIPPSPVLPPLPPVPNLPPLPRPPDLPETPDYPVIPNIDVPDILKPLPPQPPTPDEPDAKDDDVIDNDPCRRQLVSFNPQSTTPVVKALIEGYLDNEIILSFTMSASIVSYKSWTTECGINASIYEGTGGFNEVQIEGDIGTRSSRVIHSVRSVKVSGKYGCAKSGTITLTLKVKAGYPKGTTLSGVITSYAVDEKAVTPFKLYVAEDMNVIGIFGDTVASNMHHSVTIVGSFPDINDYLDPFISASLDTTSIPRSNQSYADSYTRYGCIVGALNVSFIKERETISSFTNDYIIPTLPSGTGIKGKLIWTETFYSSADNFNTNNYTSIAPPGGAFCCGWYETDSNVTLQYTTGIIGGAKTYSRVIELSGEWEQGEEITINFSTPKQPPQIPSGNPGPNTYIYNRITPSNLMLLIDEITGV